MTDNFNKLFDCEQRELLEAVRRDLRRELALASMHPELAAYHVTNYRRNIRILEVLNPRGRTREAGRAIDVPR